MQTTIIEMTVDSTKQQSTGNGKTQHTIECNIPYGQDNEFFRLSGGTTFTCATINDNAATIFKSGKKVRLTIEAIE